MVEPGLIRDPQPLHDVRDDAQAYEGHPLDQDAVGRFGRRLAHLLDAQGGYLDQPEPAPSRLCRCRDKHDLRHYYASLLIRHGESVKTVQARLGHASATETLETYAHLWPDSDDRTRVTVDAVLGGQAKPGTEGATVGY